MPSYLSAQAPWFAFLVHLRDVEDMHRINGSSFLRAYCKTEEEFQQKMCSIPTQVAGEVVFGFNSIKGEIICAMQLPTAMMAATASDAVVKCMELAAQRGARVIGLGALTAPATGGGLKLLRLVPPGITITSGNAYTAAVVRSNVITVSQALGLGKDARVAIVGCTGSVGGAATHLIAESGFRLTLVGRSAERAQRQFSNLAGSATFAGDLSVLQQVDIVVLLTSDPSALVTPEHLRPGTVVIDCAQPANIPLSEYATFRQRGSIVIEGGLVRIPEYICTIDLGLPTPADTFACLAETYLFAREGIREHSVGRASVELARRLERIAERYGIQPRPLPLSEIAPATTRDLARP